MIKALTGEPKVQTGLEDYQGMMTPASMACHMLGQAGNDWDAAEIWFQHLREKRQAKIWDKLGGVESSTIDTYRFHLAKLRWYCENVGHVLPSRWGPNDVLGFIAFLEKLPKNAYCARKIDNGIAVGRSFVKEDELGWTPFRKQPSKSSQIDIKRFVHAMFKAWHETGYIHANPAAFIAGAGKRNVHTNRSICIDVYSAVLQAIANERPVKGERYLMQVRDLFIFEALCRLGLRVTELVGAKMSAFVELQDPKTKVCFQVFHVTENTGLGGKARKVPVPPEVWQCFLHYRIAFDLPVPPMLDDDTPLLLSPRKSTKATTTLTDELRYLAMWGAVETRQGLYKIVKQRLRHAAALLRSNEKYEMASQLEAASPHWLRNTFGKSLARQGADMRVLAQALGYANAETARAYTE